MKTENGTEGQPQVGSDAGFSIGDRVQFVRARGIGASIHFKTMEGTIADISKPKGTKALIKYHGGNFIWKRMTDIRRIGQPSPLNAILGMENVKTVATEGVVESPAEAAQPSSQK